eukprot:TRINITY_DN165_c0_g1_i3.p2 TRINITY_DN165_c0_g1~~TRINITY_DN165_c0_g1_i3.p2  ORF type:complete len:243 (+),score=13.13 TRINITY_DN165_c0_g1_i3:2799-3527(+)
MIFQNYINSLRAVFHSILPKTIILNKLYCFINDYKFLFQTYNFSLFQASCLKNIYIPRFCYHVSLEIAGNCRMCLIEDKKSAKLLASCVSVLLTGLVLYTKTKVIKKCRESILEYLLMNHPLDCPICDQGGECDLQDQTLVFGGDRSRFFDEKKKSTENKNFGLEIKMFLNRCIYCGRCVRFLNKLAGQNQNVLKLLGRGYNTEISFYEKFFSLPDQLTSNIIDLCPVGALVSKPSSFFYRP